MMALRRRCLPVSLGAVTVGVRAKVHQTVRTFDLTEGNDPHHKADMACYNVDKTRSFSSSTTSRPICSTVAI